MPNIVPKIDQRNQEQLTPELRRLIYTFCSREWTDLTELEADKKAEALVQIFSNMMGKVIERLNKAPEKNFISFLNLIGISPTPPRAAKAPLLFKPKEEGDRISTIPAGTKVSAQPENQEEVIFETEKDVTVIQPQLIRAVSLDPREDRWSNQDFIFAEEATGNKAELFRGDSTVVHRLYLGHSQMLTFQEACNRLTIHYNKPEQAPDPSEWTTEGMESASKIVEMDWFYFDEAGNARPLNPRKSWETMDSCWRASYQFDHLSEVHTKVIAGYDQEVLRDWTNKWIFAVLKTSITADDFMPDIEDIRMELSIANTAALYPDLAVSNGNPLDMSKDFYPFGDKPKVNDTFYLACNEAFSKANAEISITIELSNPEICPLPDTSYVKLSWEYWNGKEWIDIENLHDAPKAASLDAAAFTDSNPHATTLTSSGTVNFSCPGIKPSQINGEENYWIRVRMTGGSYGEDAKYEYKDEAVKIGEGTLNIAQLQYTKATFAPPSIHKVTIDYNYAVESFPEMVLTENNFSFDDKTSECLKAGQYFKPFYPCVELEPMFYLAFDRNIGNLPISLFFPLAGDQLGENPIVAWEYWNGRKWLTLSVNDAIRHFTRREILQFAVPSDIEKRPLFGTEYYWIRARLDEGTFKVFPQIDTIYSNAVWARNSNTIQGEILGSSNGEADQSFTLSKTPVLPGQSLFVRESLGQGDWLRWEEVDAFSLSESESRHYKLDRSSGTLIFGDGKNGMVPPTGIDNIKCDYKHGGGAKGNVAAASITKVWDSFNWLDSVTNPVPADGGFDQEEPEQAQIRGPHTLKSWERGVTSEDMEWLVREAMPQIAKVKCLGAMNRDLEFVPGQATLIVVPESNDPKPVPSQELLSEIEAYLCERTSAILDTNIPGIAVIGPEYIRIGVEATVAFGSIEQRKVTEGHIIDNLKQFFHPLYGGDGNTGWDLGKNLYVSEVYAVIKHTPGVDYVSGIAIKASLQCYTLSLEPLEYGPYKPLIAYPKFSAIRADDNTIIFALAERIEASTGIKTLMVKGFKENERIRLRYRNYVPVELLVVSIDGDILECKTADGEPLVENFPEGSDVEFNISSDLTIRSFILNEVTAGSEAFFLKIAVFEPKDIVFLSRLDEYINTTPLKIHEVSSENIFLEENELIYGGTHFINKANEMVFPYLLDKDTNELHDLTGTTPDCHLEQIAKEDRKYLTRLADVPENATQCSYCFPVGGS
ncbi:MAG: putative baseplate assembly protein [Gorillibacterium sp.]|nr:putative baseplate assembly protein [Gorillibacterium sp.]